MGLKKKVNGEFVEVVTPGEPGTVLTADQDRKASWSKPQTKFRGAWASSQLARQFDMLDWNTLPEGFSLVSEGPGTHLTELKAVSQLTNLSGAPPAPFTHAMVVNIDYLGVGVSTGLALDLSKLRLKNISRVDCWMAKYGATTSMRNGSVSRVLRNGTPAYTSPAGAQPWSPASITAVSSDVVTFQISSIGTNNPPVLSVLGTTGISGIQIYTTEDPYMLNDFVTHEGVMWKSLIDLNHGVPGVDNTWVEALALPNPNGTTAQRPSAATAGAGFQYYDITLGQPIWSNGTAWTDAAKNVV